MDSLYILDVFHDIDDYKRGGCTFFSTTTYSYSINHLYRKVVDIINETLDDYSGRDEIKELISGNPDLFKKNCGGEWQLRRNKVPWNNTCYLLDDIHDIIAKGEFVEWKWTFEIRTLDNIESDSEQSSDEDDEEEEEEEKNQKLKMTT